MSGRSPRLRALRPRSQPNDKSPSSSSSSSLLEKQQRIQALLSGGSEEIDNAVNQFNEFELENADLRDDSDSDEPRLVIKEEPEDNEIDDKNQTEKRYKCTSCIPTLEYSDLIEYLEHLKDQHQQKSPRKVHKDTQDDRNVGDTVEPNKCTICSFVAANPSEFESHQRLHHLKRRFFRCTKCAYMTHVRARYTKHVKYHSMPMIKCDDCDFKTPYKWNLDRHNRNHGGGGPFQCGACNFTADIRQSLTVHEMNHHEPPVGHSPKKQASPFERKSRNIPKRYNQVGGSDFRELSKSPLDLDALISTEADKSPNNEMMENSMDADPTSALAEAGCLSLKCEEKGCQFVTSWDSEMQRHLIESHSSSHTPNKSRKPLPMLIPLSPGSKSTSAASPNGSPANIVNVPRVRVRPELAKIARDTEIAKLYGNRESTSPKKEVAVNSFEKRNAIFFDKLKERLVATSATTGVNQVAVSNISDLKCWCTFEANNSEELINHKKTHHTALSVSNGVSRCPKCLRRCKNTRELQMHVQVCQLNIDNNLNDYDSSQDINVKNETDYEATSYCDEFELPFQMDWDVSHGGLNSSGSSVDEVSSAPCTTSRRVFKCPHCPFWASTASRFHVHIVGHLNRKPFECSLCAYRSNWRWDITKHIKLKGARDAAHINARVLMTDETGRRNYSKYNKYLAQMETQGLDDPRLEESQGEIQSNEPARKFVILTKTSANTDFRTSRVNSRKMRALHVDINPTLSPKQSPNILRTQGQSLLRINPPPTSANIIDSSNFPSTSAEETKRTLWKCKRCNFRDSNKEMVLIHVKTHYEQMGQAHNSGTDSSKNEKKKNLTCSDCPFVTNDASLLALHKVHHRPNLEAIFKCYLCPYYVSTKAELLDHARLHGEELAVVHQQSEPDLQNKKIIHVEKKNVSVENVSQTSPSPIQIVNVSGGDTAPPLLLDTRALPDTPMVWVSRSDGTFAKMLKCRHCPYVSSRRAEVRDHETMHVNNPTINSPLSCPDCSFCCGKREVMDAHANMHSGSLGTVHCLVDDNRTDSQQLDDLKTLLGLAEIPAMGPEPDTRDSRLVHYCGMCPARFLCEKELRIHLRFHSTVLAYSCEWCSYAARQSAHLLSHHKAHSTEYRNKSRILSATYGNSQRFPPPMTACVETKNQIANGDKNTAWIVVEVPANFRKEREHYQNSISLSQQKTEGQVFCCLKCPARYYNRDALEYHMTLHGSNNSFQCSECDYSSKTSQNLMKHEVVHQRQSEATESLYRNIVPNNAAQLNTQVKLTEGNSNLVHSELLGNGKIKDKRFKCQKCPSSFEKREQYRIHLALHGSKQRYRCDTCDYAVKYYANYVQHIKKHRIHDHDQAQVSRQQDEILEIDCQDVEKDNTILIPNSRRKSTISSGSMINSMGLMLGDELTAISNQDKQSALLMQKKVGLLQSSESVDNYFSTYRCPECPFSSNDKDVLDAHKRRHGIERLTPPCPHCNYVPRKDENISDHVRLHFTRLYKPEGYLIIELISLTMKKVEENDTSDKNQENNLLFRECEDGKFLPATDVSLLPVCKTGKEVQEKVIVDPNTGETTHRF